MLCRSSKSKVLVEKDDDMTVVQWMLCMENYKNAAAILKLKSITPAAIANHIAVVGQIAEQCNTRGIHYKSAMMVCILFLFSCVCLPPPSYCIRRTISRGGNTFVTSRR